MAILLENSLASSSIRFRTNEGNTDYAKIIPINNLIKGSLTTLSDTYDIYQLNVQRPTLINVKFNVEQTTNDFDYYNLTTPVGTFSGAPNAKQFPVNGFNFLVESTALFTVQGSSQGVFTENYTLEITEIKPGYWENPISPDVVGNYASKVRSIGSNDTVDGWNPSILKLKTTPLNKGETGTFVVFLDYIKSYNNPNAVQLYYHNLATNNGVWKDSLSFTMKNEAGREIFESKSINESYFASIPNLSSGIYYINIDTNINATQYKLQINFYKTFNTKESVVYNTAGGDKFPDWDKCLDTVIYSESIKNYNISKPNSLGHFNVWHKVKPDDYDVLARVERVVFSDKTIAFDFSSSEAGYKSAMLIAASFGKDFIPQFFSKGLSYFDSGSTTKDISKLITDNKFIEQLIGDNSDSAWVKHVYKNVVGVYPDKASETNYVTLLQNKTNTRSELLELAAEFTFLESRIDLVGLQANGLVFDTLS
jgi:hypothetical protein